ncbi:set domain-containing protein [Cyclospora cayetanensis]|uniref:Set domain-containing protein n=1 Tax=Cyclospora cayetanensis TaxID=88456 RepID=A0A1D3CZZ1_9EIME|nr:set domain-containing protein [Cyclospora cayetanensis]
MVAPGKDSKRAFAQTFPIPLPPSFIAAFAMPVRSSDAPLRCHASPSSAEPGSSPGQIQPCDDSAIPQSKRQRTEVHERPSVDAVSRATPLHEATAEQEEEEEDAQPGGKKAHQGTSVETPSFVTRGQRRRAASLCSSRLKEDELPQEPPKDKRPHEQPPQKEEQKQHVQRQDTKPNPQQFAVAVALLQSLPIWKRHPESIPALVKAAAAVAAERQRGDGRGSPSTFDSMLDGPPFISATIHWEAKRQSVCVKAFKDTGFHCSCRYFPLRLLEPAEGTRLVPQLLKKSSALQAGEQRKHVTECPKRLLFVAYVFFLQLPLRRAESLAQGGPRARQLPLLGRSLLRGCPREGTGESVRGFSSSEGGQPQSESCRRGEGGDVAGSSASNEFFEDCCADIRAIGILWRCPYLRRIAFTFGSVMRL